METYIDFFNSSVIGGVSLLIGFFFFIKCLREQGKFYRNLLLAVSGCAVMQLLPTVSAVQYLVYAVFLLAVGFLAFHADWKSVFLYAALTVEIMELCFGIVNSLSGILYPKIASLHRNAAAVMSVLLGMLVLLMAGFFYYTVNRLFFNDETMEKQYLFVILIPILLLFFMDEYISAVLYGSTAVQNAGGSNIAVNHYQMLAIQLFGMASLFCILFAYKKLLQNVRLHTELSLLEQEEHTLNRYVEEARARYEKTKSFRHDIRNHITVVKDLLRGGKEDEALTYLGNLAEMTEELSFPCGTGNPAADILIGNKLGIAESRGIEAECSLLLPYPCEIRDIDLCIVLSNALDNAIRACRDAGDGVRKYIRVTGRVQGDFVLLEIENGFSGKGPVRKGTGLSNIGAIAEKYQGSMSIKTEDDTFLLSVLLVIPRHAESILRQNG